MQINKKILKKIAFSVLLIAIAVIWRIVNHDLQIAPNLELVTVASVLAAVVIGWQAALIVPLSTMIISDIFIGNSSIFIFTWSSFAVIGLGALVLRKLNNQPKFQILNSIGFTTISSLFFFAVTNFGVWAQGWYPATWAGLQNCFIMALPFYRTMFIGNLILVPSAIAIWQLVKNRQVVKDLVINSLVR